MAYGNHPQWSPKSFTEGSTTGAGTVSLFATGTPTQVSHFVVACTAAAIVNFQGAGGGTHIMRVDFGARNTFVIPGWTVDTNGLEVTNSVGDMSVTAFHGSIAT